MSKTGYSTEGIKYSTMLKNETNLNAIRKLVSIQLNMMLNEQEYHAGLLDKDQYAKNVATTQESLTKILTDTKKDLDYLAEFEKEQYDALNDKRGS